jgi:hypothetical protein
MDENAVKILQTYFHQLHIWEYGKRSTRKNTLQPPKNFLFEKDDVMRHYTFSTCGKTGKTVFSPS